MDLRKIFFVAACFVFIFSIPAIATAEKVFDPVCGMKIEKDSAIQAEYDGKVYCFCSEDCFSQFEKDPDNFACPCPPGSKDCLHCQGKAAKCPCGIEAHADEHKGHGHHPEHGH